MSQENVEMMRGSEEAFNRRDREAFLAPFDPVAEWHVTGLVVDQKTFYRGREEIWRYVTVLDDQFEDLQVDFKEFFDAGDRVVVIGRMHGRGRTSGAPVDLRWAIVVAFSKGRIVRLDNYAEKDQALEAVGLSEQDAHADP
jgi:ketosteroid isomerase-like protein